ncbi:hypothetical protein N7474_010108, partial [Penicillium riverlandense]|uniref:uncharacterized protein n=1 Tax=Penicillium riverlandense TaxID=1903569 RepID=UPI002547DDDD
MAQFTPREIHLATERSLKYQGTAKIRLDKIYFDARYARQLDRQNVERLRRIFGEEGCQNLALQHRIPAIVSSNHLKSALQEANVNASALLAKSEANIPCLDFQSGQVQGLHGFHRVTAGLECLQHPHRFWAVDLYLSDIGDDLKRTLVDEYSNEKKPSEGEIMWKMRQYDFHGDLHGELRWKARLSENSKRRLAQLNKVPEVRKAFFDVLSIPGQRDFMSLSKLNDVLGKKCRQEVVNYLGYIKNSWYSWVNGEISSITRIDRKTVEELQQMAPCIEISDIQGLLFSGQVFSQFNEDERSQIWERLKTFKGLIPSLHGFFEDFKPFANWADCLFRLFTPLGERRFTVREEMAKMLTALNSNDIPCIVQTSEHTYRRMRNPSDCFEIAYRQLWLYAMRYSPQMPPEPKRKNHKAKARSAPADEVVVSEMASLASRLGFRSPQIETLLKDSPDRLIAKRALLKARKPESFYYDDSDLDLSIDQIIGCFAKAKPSKSTERRSAFMELAKDKKTRCGYSDERALQHDRPYLFLDYMHATDTPDTVTTLFVRRCMYLAFFGPLPDFDMEVNNSPTSGLAKASSSALQPGDRTEVRKEQTENYPIEPSDCARESTKPSLQRQEQNDGESEIGSTGTFNEPVAALNAETFGRGQNSPEFSPHRRENTEEGGQAFQDDVNATALESFFRDVLDAEARQRELGDSTGRDQTPRPSQILRDREKALANLTDAPPTTASEIASLELDLPALMEQFRSTSSQSDSNNCEAETAVGLGENFADQQKFQPNDSVGSPTKGKETRAISRADFPPVARQPDVQNGLTPITFWVHSQSDWCVDRTVLVKESNWQSLQNAIRDYKER